MKQIDPEHELIEIVHPTDSVIVINSVELGTPASREELTQNSILRKVNETVIGSGGIRDFNSTIELLAADRSPTSPLVLELLVQPKATSVQSPEATDVIKRQPLELKMAFQLIDVDSSGTLDRNEVLQMVKILGKQLTGKEQRATMQVGGSFVVAANWYYTTYWCYCSR